MNGMPLMNVVTEGSTPFRLSLNYGDVGHALIIGPTGAGKSTLLRALESAWLRYPNAQVYTFDKNNMILQPVPSGTQEMRLTYSYMVANMTSDSDTPDLPEPA